MTGETHKAVERIADSFAAAHDAFVLVVSEGALVADAREGRRSHVTIADGAFAIALIAEAAD
jgi:D-Tyr-tRNAtyr deacylase